MYQTRSQDSEFLTLNTIGAPCISPALTELLLCAKSLVSSSPLIFKTTLSGSTHFTGEDFEAEKGQESQSHSRVGVRAEESAEFQNLADSVTRAAPLYLYTPGIGVSVSQLWRHIRTWGREMPGFHPKLIKPESLGSKLVIFILTSPADSNVQCTARVKIYRVRGLDREENA